MTSLHPQPTIRLGCTFTPEKYPDADSAQQALRFVLDTLHIRDIRFALRWNAIEDTPTINDSDTTHKTNTQNTLTLAYYKPFFDILAQYSDLRLCLNIGPLKTTDWPEFHVPQTLITNYTHQDSSVVRHYLDTLQDLINPPSTKSPILPRWPFELQQDHPLVTEATTYLHALCTLLTTTLPTTLLDCITIIQLNNECFNPFGHQLVVTSIETELKFIAIASKYFGSASVLINSAGKLQARKILKTQSQLHERGISNHTILGMDYYYHTPANDFRFIRNYNQLNLPLPWLSRMSTILNRLEHINATLEFTEVQMEQWGHIQYPRESAPALDKAIRLLATYKPDHQEYLLLRLWGVELLAHNYITQQQTPAMDELVNYIRSYTIA